MTYGRVVLGGVVNDRCRNEYEDYKFVKYEKANKLVLVTSQVSVELNSL